MNFPFLVARRYLFAKKSHNAVNVISMVSVVGVAVGALALVIVMSVFNGFEDLTRKLYSAFDPDLKVTVTAGKNFTADSVKLQQLEADPDVFAFAQTIEENVMAEYGEQQEIAVLKGVDEQYRRVTGIDTMMHEGHFLLWENHTPQAVVGLAMSYKLRVGLNFIAPLRFYAVRNTPNVSLNPEKALNQKLIFPSGKFDIDEEINSQYILVPIEFARDLLENGSITGAIEIKLKPGADEAKVQKRVAAIFGEGFDVKNTYQQKEFAYKILKSEKFMGFMILTFVLLIASFNVVGSLSMLMIEKKSDMFILQSMGADKQMLGRIFITQGWMIVLAGAFAGLLLGALVCQLQIESGFFKVTGDGTYIIDSYPVAMRWRDFVMILVAVAGVSFLTIYFPVKYFVKKYIM
ncbi:MAG: ABC transporter permease [Bacteroidales bacterium]|jgi:lipoprotein-releasing system permease protein|nr:ABC transporter permease [Bacteroidales bacterium]